MGSHAKLSDPDWASPWLCAIAYYVAFGPHGPREPILPAGAGAKTFGGTIAAVLIAAGLFYTVRLFGQSTFAGVPRASREKGELIRYRIAGTEKPRTVTKEWQEASNARAVEQKQDPFTVRSSPPRQLWRTLLILALTGSFVPWIHWKGIRRLSGSLSSREGGKRGLWERGLECWCRNGRRTLEVFETEGVLFVDQAVALALGLLSGVGWRAGSKSRGWFYSVELLSLFPLSPPPTFFCASSNLRITSWHETVCARTRSLVSSRSSHSYPPLLERD